MSRDVRDWRVDCKECGNQFAYSDRAAAEAALRGESRPERCPSCRQSHNRATQRMGAPYVDLAPGRPVLPGGLKAGRLGRLRHPNREHRADGTPPPVIDPEGFGIRDEHMVQFLLDLEPVQVAIVVAPTGSGKSTFFPYRLMQPPSPLPEDFMTRHGKIIVTQPRIEASSSIPRFVAEQLHGSACGPGADIGYKNSRHAETDTRNRLVYLTDGTLLNMIRRGELHDVAAVVIDEAHERSLNIDLIIALLRRELRALPHLKLIIASATIDSELFHDFFQPDFDVLVASFPGKTKYPVAQRFRRAEPIPDAQLVARMPGEVARTAYEVLLWMAGRVHRTDMDASIDLYDGDILCFLHGKAAIAAAIKELKGLLEEDPEIERQVAVYPLHAELSESAIRRALSRPDPSSTRGRKRKKRPRSGAGDRPAERWRVIVATTIAETSLTVEGVRHVVDSGLVNQPSWDPVTATNVVRPTLHSQSGLIQRRGRAGRVAPGMWHLLLTREQFESRPRSTPPEIADAPLEQLVLAAAAAGVGDPQSLRWLPPGPPAGELHRARAALRHVGAVDGSGDPTPLGRELGASREPIPHASLLASADTTGCAVEAATALAAMRAGGLSALLRWNSDWPPSTRVHVHRIHRAVLAQCPDDLEAVLHLWSGWESCSQHQRADWASRRFLNPSAFREIEKHRRRLLEGLQQKTRTEAVRPVRAELVERLRRTVLWSLPDAIYALDDEGQYQPMVTARSDAARVEQVNSGVRLRIDPASRCAATTPHAIVAVNRVRRRRWVSPLEPAVEHVEVSFCVAVDPTVASERQLLIAARSEIDARWNEPSALPGDRFRVSGPFEAGQPLRVLEILEPRPAVAVALADDAELDQDRDEEETNDLAVVEEAAAADVTTLEDLDSPPDDEAVAFDDTDEEDGLDARDSIDDDKAFALIALEPAEEGESDVEVTAVELDGRALCAFNRESQMLEDFASEHGIGSRVSLFIVDAMRFPRDARVVVTGRHEPTGLEVLVDRNAFGVGVRDVLLERVVGTMLDFHVEHLDLEAGLVEVSRTAASITALDKLAAIAPHTVGGEVVDVWQDRLHVLVEVPEATPTSPFIVFDVAATDLPVRPKEMRIGQTVRVRIRTRREGRSERYYVGVIDDFRMPSGGLALEGDRLVAPAPVPSADVLRMMRATARAPRASGVRLRAATRAVALRSHRPRAQIVDVTGIRTVMEASEPAGTIVDIGDDAVVVGLEGGTRLRVPTRFTTWNDADRPVFEVGDQVPVFVTDASPDDGHLVVSLRNPGANPYASLSTDAWVDAEILRTDGRGALRLRETSAGAELTMHPNESGLARGEPLLALGDRGDVLRVRVVKLDVAGAYATCSRFHPTLRVPLDGQRELLMAGLEPRQAVRAFRDHFPRTARVSVDDLGLAVRWLEADPGDGALALVVEALGGPLVKIGTPSISVLTGNRGARLDELRQRFRVCANVVRIEGRPHLIAATPSESAATELFQAVQRLYPVNHVRVGRYRRPDMDRFEEAGYRVWWNGPPESTGRDGYLEPDSGGASAAMSMLQACGIGVADRGVGSHPRVTFEWLAGSRAAPHAVTIATGDRHR